MNAPVVERLLRRANARAPRFALPLGLLLAALLAAATAAYNLASGPLHNLNDIGGWRNRLLFTAMAAAAHFLLLAAAAVLSRRESVPRIALRQLIVTAGLLLMWTAINQKTYVYLRAVQPIVREMDALGLSAAAHADLPLSAPALTLLDLITRGPVYDMYLLKLFAIFCDAALALLAMRAMDARQGGLRAEAALALCLILPQGFLCAACCGLFDHAALLLLALSLGLCAGKLGGRARPLCGALCFGGALALSGLALYALPVYALMLQKKRMRPAHLLCGAALALAACLPAAAAGMGVGNALLSLTRANLATPPFASGAPGLMNLFPRAAVEEMPGYVMLNRIPAVDTVTNAQPYYTQAHMEIAMRSLTLLGLTLLLGVWALALRDRGMSPLRRALALTLGALFVCPGVTAAAWLAADMLCVLALLSEPELRPCACLSLFGTMCAAAYPATGETMLPMIVSTALCGAALLLALGVFDGSKGESARGRRE